MERWYNESAVDKKIAYEQIGEKINLPAYAVEKDWWVVQTLTLLLKTEIGKHLVFKGGTSLSKAWGLIERFSEDIDLAADRSFYKFEGDLNKRGRTNLRKTAKIYTIETLFPELKKMFLDAGLINVDLQIGEITSSDQDPVIINVNYPNVIDSPGYIQPRVQIEIGCRSLFEPNESRTIISLVDEQYPTAKFSQEPIQIPTVVPARTFLEKIFLLHEEFQRPKEKIRVDRLSRHLYDVFQLLKTDYGKQALEDKELYTTIVKHRQSFTRVGGVDYNLHQPQTINPLPPESMLSDWEADYKTMQEQMIPGNSPNFKDLMIELSNLKEKINGFDWIMEGEFYKPNKE